MFNGYSYFLRSNIKRTQVKCLSGGDIGCSFTQHTFKGTHIHTHPDGWVKCFSLNQRWLQHMRNHHNHISLSTVHLLSGFPFSLFSVFLPTLFAFLLLNYSLFLPNPFFPFLFLHILSVLVLYSCLFNLTVLSFPLFPLTNSTGNANQSQLRATSSNSAPASFL